MSLKAVCWFLLFIVGIGLNSYSQIPEKPLGRPSKYRKPTVVTQQKTGMDRLYGPEVWKVWIDRENVTTSNGQKTRFLEEFFVVGESEDQVHIVKDNGSYNPVKRLFSDLTLPIDYGWIPKEYLILWNTALYDEGTGFREKVLTISDVNHMSTIKEEIMRGEKQMEYYPSPVATQTLNIETPIFEVFYVFKISGKRSLLGKVEDLSRMKAENVIHGWVNTDIVQEWGHRQTLEPRKDPQAVAIHRKNAGVKTSIFANIGNVSNYIENPRDNSRSFWSNDKYEDGYETNWYRLPILSQNGEIVETAVISDLISVKKEGGEVTMDTITDEEFNSYRQRYEDQVEKTARINMVFVIDGTRSMDDPIESVKKGVIQAASRLDATINKFQYGAVIYRDYAYPEDERCFELLRMGDYRQFYSFMNKVRTDNPACFNNTVSEGLYKGLKMTESLFRGREKETNVIVLVGDAGDRVEKGRVGSDEVIRMLARYNVSLITIQAHNWEDKSYDDFIMQTRELSLQSAMRISEGQKRIYSSTNVAALTTSPKFRRDSRGIRTLYNLEDSPVDGAVQYASGGTEIPASTIETEVRRIIQEIDSSNTVLLENLARLIGGYGESGFSKEAIQILINAQFDADFIELLSTKRYQFMLGGYTAIRVQGLNDDIYSFVLFVDEQELNELNETLNRLVVPGRTASERREGLYNAFIKLLTVNYGATVAEVNDRNVQEIMELITGLPSKSDILDLKVGEIRDPIAMPDSRLNEVINYIKEKRDLLVRVPANEKYSFSQDFRRYFWLPQSILP